MKASNARTTALFVLNSLNKENKTLDVIFEGIYRRPSFLLSKKDQALFNTLVYGVLRWRGRLDWIIAHFSKTRINKIDPAVMNILRLGLFQIIYLDRIPVSAAINTSVEMSKSFGAPWIARFINGLLRNAARSHEKVPFPDIDKDPVNALAARKSFPCWLIEKWLKQSGFKETVALCNAINNIPSITVRVNTLKTSRTELIKQLEYNAENVRQTFYSPEGISFIKPKQPVSEMQAFKDGWFQVQDEAAQLVSLLLDPQPGDIVLDACAGFGGKTGHMAQLMKNSGRILAVDKSRKRLLNLESAMNRLGISIVTNQCLDLNDFAPEMLSASGFGLEFDRILLDAPCSGLGVLRRNPDAKWVACKKFLGNYKKKQIKLLDNLARFVKLSGIMVYSVCSTEPEENQEVVECFLNKHAEFAIHKNYGGITVNAKPLFIQNKYLKTLPHRDGMDGFFAACFKRIK